MKKYLYLGAFACLIIVIVVLSMNPNALMGRFIPDSRNASSNAQASTKIDAQNMRFVDKEAYLRKIEEKIREHNAKKRGKRESKDESSEEMLELIESIDLPFPVISLREDSYFQKNSPTDDAAPLAAWKHQGIKGTGVIRSIDFDKNNTSHLIMATSSHIYDSYDFGSSWKNINFPANYIQEVAIDPNNKNHYLVIAGEKSLFDSSDAGKTWTLSYTFNSLGGPYSINWFNTILYVSKGTTDLISTTNGKTWEVYTIPQNMRSSQTKMNANGFGLRYGWHELYKTSNFGKTWNKILTFDKQLDPGNSENTAPFDISDDGKFIFAAWRTTDEIEIMRSYDGGETWGKVKNQLVNYKYLGIQSVMIDQKNTQHVIVFEYMLGPYESYDGGASFSQIYPSTYENTVTISDTYNANAKFVITPLDNLYGETRLISGSDTNKFIIPTDQGLFVYTDKTKTMRNIANNIYMGTTRGPLGITSCSRIYAGLWHVGNFFIDQDQSIKGTNAGGEMNSAYVGEDEGCNTQVLLSGLGNMLYKGISIDSVPNNLQFTYSIPLQFLDGWWYGTQDTEEGKQEFVKYNKDFTKKEIIPTPITDGDYFTYYIENNNGNETFWLTNMDGMKIWKSTDLKKWITIKESTPRDCFHFQHLNIFANGNTIILSRNTEPWGLTISNDGGKNWTSMFQHTFPSNIVEDSKGRIFVGISPMFSDESDNLDLNGIWFSSDKGKTWNRYGIGSGKSDVTGLTLDKTTNTLYGSTSDESIISISLNYY